MPAPSDRAASHLPLTVPVFHVLLAVTDRAQHGYAIIQDVARRTGDEVRLTAGTLYGALARLLDAGLVEEVCPRAGNAADARRRSYRITALGREVAHLEARRLERCAEMAREKRLLPRLKPTTR